VRHLLGALLQHDLPAVVDMEAGLEHLSRGTERHADVVLVVLEPYYKALETGRRIAELAGELGIARVAAVANKLRDDEDRAAIRDFAARHGLAIEAELPYDEELRRAERGATPPVPLERSPALREVARLADRLFGAA
jgi:CO dehydrogenase maturation factor